MSRKITVEIDDAIGCMFINYVAMQETGAAIMGCKPLGTMEIMQACTSGEPVKVIVQSIEKENNQDGE